MKTLNLIALISVLLWLAPSSKVSAQQKFDFSNKVEEPDLRELHDAQEKDTEPMFHNLAVPKKWEGESAVVLAIKSKAEGTYVEGYPKFKLYYRVRIKLLDFNAVEEFTDYYFEQGNLTEISIIKPDGLTQLVNLDEAVDDNSETFGESFMSRFLSRKKMKIAIKNLEVGDIIDFSGLSEVQTNEYAVTVYLNSAAPVVASKRIFTMDKKNHMFCFKSLNGAPSYEEETEGTEKTYTITDSLREKTKKEPMSYHSISDPCIKVNIVATSPAFIQQLYPFSIIKNEVKTSITQADLVAYVRKVMATPTTKGTDLYVQFLKQYGPDLNDEDYVSKFYYLCRKDFFLEDIALKREYKQSGMALIKKMIQHLAKRKIPYQVILCTAKEDGNITDILFEDELSWALRIRLQDKDLYISHFSPFTNINELHESIEGTQAYAFSKPLSKHRIKVESITLPVSAASQNTMESDIHVSFPAVSDSALLKRTVTVSGLLSKQFIGYTFNPMTALKEYKDYLLQQGYSSPKKTPLLLVNPEVYRNATQGFLEKEETRMITHKSTVWEIYLKKEMKEREEDQYHILDYRKFEPLSDKRNAQNPVAAWKDEFIVGDILHQSGKSYVLDVGELFGQLYEVTLKENRENRQVPFIIEMNRIYRINMVIELPEGYQTNIPDLLNQKLETTTGIFTISTKLEESKLIITLIKQYKAGKYLPDQWNDFLNFTDIGAEFIKSKIVLDPIQK